jgi:hypothetical protein
MRLTCVNPGVETNLVKGQVYAIHAFKQDQQERNLVEVEGLGWFEAHRFEAQAPAPDQPSTLDQALRHNQCKPELSYLLTFPLALEAFSRACTQGASVYGRGNYLKGAPLSQSLDSLLRHLMAFANGEDIDPKSGQAHVGHIVWNALRLAQEHLSPAPGTVDDRIGYAVQNHVVPTP